MNQRKPLFLKFSTDKNKYVYDTITNRIFKVDELIHKMLDDFFTLPREKLISKYSQSYAIPEIKGAIQRISEKIEKDGLFFPKRPVKMRLPLEKEKYFSFYDGDLQDLIFNITEQCNMRCKYCAYSGSYLYERTHRNNFMNFDTAKKVVDFFRIHSRKRKKVYYTFYGGEPLLNFPVIKKVVEYVKATETDRELFYGLTTNGILLKDEIMDFLIENDFLLTVSLNGPQKVHDHYRILANGGPTFELITKNLKNIKDRDEEYYNKRVSFNVTMCPPYDLSGLLEFFQTHDLVRDHHIRANFVEPNDTNFFDQFKKEDLDLSDDWKKLEAFYIENATQGDQVNDFVRNFFEKGMIRLHKRPMVSLDGVIHVLGMCTPGVRRLFVSPEGRFYICEKVGYHFPIGDVESGFDFDRIFSLLNQFISISQKECTECWAMRLCSSCFFNAKKDKKLDKQRKKEYCPIEKNHLRSLFIIYCSIREKNPQDLSFLDNAVFE